MRALWIIFPLCLLACIISSFPEDPRPPLDVVLVYSGNLEGELEPCGCTEGQLGGLARRATLVKRLREGNARVVLLDAGDIFFRRESIPDILRPQLLLKAETIAQLYAAMKYDAVTAGELDEALPATAPPLPHSGSEVLVRELDGIRVAIAGPILQTRPDDVDLLVCLSHQGLGGDKALATRSPLLDVIIGAHDGASLETPLRVGKTLIVQAGRQGKFLGVLRLHLLPGWRDGDLLDASENEHLRELAAEYDAVVERFTRERDAATTPGERERAEARIAHYQKEARNARAQVRDVPDRSWFANRLVPLDARIPDDPDAARVVAEYKRKVRELNESIAEAQASAPKEGPAYVGGTSCVGCHTQIHQSWAETSHARAYETLGRRGQEMDLECVGCHSTAFQEKGGFFLPAKVGEWKGVQCEACHGPGGDHPPRRLASPLPKDACLRCHQPPQQEGFDYERSLPRVLHVR